LNDLNHLFTKIINKFIIYFKTEIVHHKEIWN